MTPEQVMELSIANVTRARNQIDDVEWSAEDGTRSEMDYLCRIVEAVIKAGATTVNIPDTVGYTVPEEYTHFMRTLIERVPNSDKVVFSAHCHDDLGLGVANTLAAIQGGARQVECTVNGIGERAGNASLEEIVMAMRTRRDFMLGLVLSLLASATPTPRRLITRSTAQYVPNAERSPTSSKESPRKSAATKAS